MPTSAEIEQMLTGPGGPFEVVEQPVNGIPMKVYKQRMTSLREVAALGLARGDTDTHVVYGDRRYGFADFVSLANSVSRTIQSQFGIGPGDRVAVLSANNPEWCLTFWGTVNMGSVLVGLNGWWKTDEILYGLNDSGARLLVADAARLKRVADRLGECPQLEGVVVIGAEPEPLPAGPPVHRFDELLGSRSPDLPVEQIAEDDPAVIFYTSGTTGRPKGAVSTHRSMIANLQNTLYNAVAGMMSNPEGAVLPSSGQAAALLTSPLFHVSGCHSGIVVAMAAGIKAVMPVGKFEPEKAMTLIQEEKITVWATVPTMVWRVVEHPDRHSYDLTSVTSVAYGGSPSAAELQRRVRETFPNVRTLGNAYGLTESSSVATVNSGQEFFDRPDSVGRPLPVVDIRCVDEEGKDVPTGQVGEVWIKGPIIMPGYWNQPEATAETITGGWLHTGDIGYVDPEGFLYITDRAKDMIIRGGENIYCVEIENRLVEHPAIAEAAVIGVPHPTLGEEVKAVIRLESGASVSESEVKAWVADALADFKVPAHLEFTDDFLPRNPSGKLLKNVLRGEGEVSFAETL
ncbi:MAG TPA: AMP-binding protein [Acidimicrobiales bacterium]|nr:AMP-binding protein [Acidimicrobiales bacterium]